MSTYKIARAQPNGWPVSCQKIAGGATVFCLKKIRPNNLKSERSKEYKTSRVHGK